LDAFQQEVTHNNSVTWCIITSLFTNVKQGDDYCFTELLVGRYPLNYGCNTDLRIMQCIKESTNRNSFLWNGRKDSDSLVMQKSVATFIIQILSTFGVKREKPERGYVRERLY